MAFERLQGLGEEKWRTILNHLLRGKPAMALARMIQQEWGDYVGVAEKTLTQQLNRLRLSVAEGAFGPAMAAEIQKGRPPKVPSGLELTLTALERLEEASTVQYERMQLLVARERARTPGRGEGQLIMAVNQTVEGYSRMLQDIQKLRFDLGLDEYKGVIGVKGTQASVTFPDGTHVQKQVFEAATVVDQILNRRRIHAPPSQADREGGR